MSLKKIGEYHIGKLIGEGGNSYVYEIVGDSSKVLKKIKEGLSTKQYTRAKSEIAQLKRLKDKGLRVLPVLDSYIPDNPTKDGSIYFLMPFADVLSNKKNMNMDQAVESVLQVARNLKDLITSEPGFLHRDIKPQNIFFITTNGY